LPAFCRSARTVSDLARSVLGGATGRLDALH
jgi:hypothetical protein